MNDYKYDDENDDEKYDDVNNFYIMDNGLIVFDEKSLIHHFACIIETTSDTVAFFGQPMNKATAVTAAQSTVEILKSMFNKRKGEK